MRHALVLAGDSARLVETSLQLGYVWKAGLIAEPARGYTGRRPGPSHP